MRTTEVRFAHNLTRLFKAQWLIQSQRRLPDSGLEAALAARGVGVVSPQDVLTPPYTPRREPYTAPPEPPQAAPQPPCHVFDNRFAPVMGLAQVQLLTNTLVRPSLPHYATQHPLTQQEQEAFTEAILYSHLLDSHQEKLPRIHDVLKQPGKNLPMEYGIPLRRRHKNLTYQVNVLLDAWQDAGGYKPLLENFTSRVTLKHSGRLMQLNMNAAYMLASPTPLPPVEVEEEGGEGSEGELPDLYPISPFINCKTRTTYEAEDKFELSPRYHPHTIFIHNNQPRMRLSQEQFEATTLLHAYTHAAAYAARTPKTDLESRPVTIQAVHMNGSLVHVGVLQLHTTDPAHPRRNLFFTTPAAHLFTKCAWVDATPTLEGVNHHLLVKLKGLRART